MSDEPDRRPDVSEALRLKRDYVWPCVYHFYRRPPLIVAAEDCDLIDADGRRYLDLYSGVTVVNAGHCNAAINAAAAAQMARLDHTTTIYLSEPMLRLAERLARITPGELKRSFFCASGSEANEAAMLLASLYTGRGEFVALSHSLHGRTKAAMSVTGLEMWRTDPSLPATVHFAPRPDAAEDERNAGERLAGELDAVIHCAGPDRVAALVAEPIQGNGGIVVPPPDYWPRVRDICDRHGILLIFDEVQTGMNRTGRWWACEHWGVTPDILTSAKALANGYPIAAVVTADRIAAAYARPGASTFGGNPVGAAAAMATIDYHQRHGLGQRSQALGARLLDRLRSLSADRSALRRPRGMGLMVAVDVVAGSDQPSPERLDALLEELKDRGYLCGKTGPQRNVLTLMPPLTITRERLDAFIDELPAAMEAIG